MEFMVLLLLLTSIGNSKGWNPFKPTFQRINTVPSRSVIEINVKTGDTHPLVDHRSLTLSLNDGDENLHHLHETTLTRLPLTRALLLLLNDLSTDVPRQFPEWNSRFSHAFHRDPAKSCRGDCLPQGNSPQRRRVGGWDLVSGSRTTIHHPQCTQWHFH